MPEPEPVGQPQQPPVPAPRKRKPRMDALTKLKKKYRLDEEVRLDAVGPDGQKQGWGPLMNPQVFEKLASLDQTEDKRYLDWMLFQAGGAAPAFKLSLEMWGEGSKETTPEQFIAKFDREVPVRISAKNIQPIIERLKEHAGIDVPGLAKHVQELVQAGALPNDSERSQAIMTILNNREVGTPEERERITKELLSYKLKTWIRNQANTKVRDRVHAVYIFNRLAQGKTREQAEAGYLKNEPELKREYVFGDEDNLRYRLFGFYRNWPGGKEGIYEKVYNAMREFLINKLRVENRNSQLDKINAQIQAKNQGLPPEDQMPLRERIDISVEIGTVKLDRKMHLTYSGPYPTLGSLTTANEAIMDLPLRERVAFDVRYAGHKSSSGARTKLYSDDVLDVMVPLTVAAAVKSGHKSWDVADPGQLDVNSRTSSSLGMWTQWALGHHGHPEWQGSRAIPVYFHIKQNGQVVFKMMLVVFLADLVSLKPPYMGTLWQLQGSGTEIHFKEMVKALDQALEHPLYIAAMKSISKALRVLRQWGQEFDPDFEMVSDFMKHHKDALQGRRGLREEILLRARQIVELLTE
jgi:hypothetical protein